jgi:hypothetical protein
MIHVENGLIGCIGCPYDFGHRPAEDQLGCGVRHDRLGRKDDAFTVNNARVRDQRSENKCENPTEINAHFGLHKDSCFTN